MLNPAQLDTTQLARQRLFWHRIQSAFLFTKKDDEEPKPAPKGFEKFFKKKDETPKETSAAKKEEDKASQKKKEDEENISEEEDTSAKKDDKKEVKSDSGPLGQLKGFYFNPNGSPIFENWLLVLMLSGVLYFYLSSKSPSQEITYMDFVNQYLSKNQVKMVTITEDKTSDMFKYKAVIETLDGKKVHLVLPQVENFLYKLDLA